MYRIYHICAIFASYNGTMKGSENMFGHGFSGCGFYGMRAGMGLGMWFLPLVIGAIIVISIILFSRMRAKSTQPSHAQQILDERYARGEITEEEYIHYKNTLY